MAKIEIEFIKWKMEVRASIRKSRPSGAVSIQFSNSMPQYKPSVATSRPAPSAGGLRRPAPHLPPSTTGSPAETGTGPPERPSHCLPADERYYTTNILFNIIMRVSGRDTKGRRARAPTCTGSYLKRIVMVAFLAACIFLAGLFIGVEFVATHQSDGHESGPRHLRRRKSPEGATAVGASATITSSIVSESVQAAKAKSAKLLEGALKQQDKLQEAFSQLRESQQSHGGAISAKAEAVPKRLSRQQDTRKQQVVPRFSKTDKAAEPATGDSVQLIGDHHIVVNGKALDRSWDQTHPSLAADMDTAADIAVEAWCVVLFGMY